jgi:hypothetical protein
MADILRNVMKFEMESETYVYIFLLNEPLLNSTACPVVTFTTNCCMIASKDLHSSRYLLYKVSKHAVRVVSRHLKQLNTHSRRYGYTISVPLPSLYSLPALSPARTSSGWCVADWASESVSPAAVQFLSPTTEGETLASAPLFRGSGDKPSCHLSDARHVLQLQVPSL